MTPTWFDARRTLLVLVALFLGLAAARLASASFDLRLATADDETVAAGLSDPGRLSDSVLLDLSIGRFYAGGKFWFLGRLQTLAGESPWLLALARSLFILLPAAAAWWLFGLVLQSAEAGALAVLLWTATFSLSIGYQPLFSNPLLLLGLAASLGSCAAAIQARSSPRPTAWRLGSVALFAFALLMHEEFVLFLAALLWTKLSPRGATAGRRSWLHFATPYLLVVTAYIGLYFLLRHHAAPQLTTYSGTRIEPRLTRALQALWNYTVSACPGFEIFYKRSAGRTEVPLYPAAEIARRLALHVRWPDAVFAALVGSIAARLVFRLGQLPRPRPSRLLVGATAALVFLPNVLIACTPKYQTWAHHRHLPYYYSALGLAFFWLLVTWCLGDAMTRLFNQGRKFLLLGAALMGVGTAAGVTAIAAANREVVLQLIAQPFR